jgi:multiple antibiotic resistance protein
LVLRRLGIGLPAFQIDGGLLLLVSYRMIFGDRPQIGARDWQGQVGARFRRSRISACHSAHGGPGALATILLLSGNALSIERLFVLIVVVAIVCAISAVDFSGAKLVARTLGCTGNALLFPVARHPASSLNAMPRTTGS